VRPPPAAGGDGVAAAIRAERFIRDHTEIERPPLVPEIQLHLATEITPIWQATEAWLERTGVSPPFWAFPWAGGQALARFVLDHPEQIRERKVLDFGAGSGLVAIAAAMAGASAVRAAEIDPLAGAAITMNATLNHVAIVTVLGDLIGSVPEERVILVGDMCYERPLADRLLNWLRELAWSGWTVLIGDPGRAYVPVSGIEELGRYRVQTSCELEDCSERDTSVWRLSA
jgi:predicted nicotinamide N-methyase